MYMIKTFNEFFRKELTNLEICEILLSNMITEASEKELVAYKNTTTNQKVYSTGHFINDRGHRIWWEDFNDPKFTEFARICLSRLYYLKKKWDKDKSSAPKVTFTFREVFGFITTDKKRAWVTSLRDSGNGEYTSFSIMTVLNVDTPDAKAKEVYFSKEVHPMDIRLTESVMVNNTLIHIIEV
jgi:hypothetical protein